MTAICGRCRHTMHPRELLSDRERDVLRLMAQGCSNLGIARRLWVGEGTVEKHVRSIYRRLDIREQPEENRRVLAVLIELSDRHEHDPDTVGLDELDGWQLEGSTT